ncbi:MAG: C40 family peptidase [Gammaproteobacteria bacterium]
MNAKPLSSSAGAAIALSRFSDVLRNTTSLLITTVLPFSIIFLLSACASPEKRSVSTSDVYGKGSAVRNGELERLLRDNLSNWQEARYRFGGESWRGIDCSGFVMHVYEDLFRITLPRTSAAQADLGYRVSNTELEAGDLVFFKPPSYPYHVGIYLSAGEFVHVSSSRGVTVANLRSGYWRRYFWTAKRIPLLRPTPCAFGTRDCATVDRAVQ